jgi:hypothetical protein
MVTILSFHLILFSKNDVIFAKIKQKHAICYFVADDRWHSTTATNYYCGGWV